MPARRLEGGGEEQAPLALGRRQTDDGGAVTMPRDVDAIGRRAIVGGELASNIEEGAR